MIRYHEVAGRQQKWTPPPELVAPGQRDVSLSVMGIIMIFVTCFLLLGGVGLGIGLELQSTRRAGLQKQLNEQGQDVQAVVTRHWRSGGEDDHPMLDYRFQTAGGVYRNSVEAPDRIWRRLVAGSPLAVRFLPSNPSRNHPRDWPVGRTPLWVILLASVSLASGGVIIAFVLRKQLALLRDGHPAPGIVTRHSAGAEGQKRVHYEFALLDGSSVSGKSLRRSRKSPPIGSAVCVLYDPENPRRNALYPMDMVRIAR